jgi:hypothetical protein
MITVGKTRLLNVESTLCDRRGRTNAEARLGLPWPDCPNGRVLAPIYADCPSNQHGTGALKVLCALPRFCAADARLVNSGCFPWAAKR